MCIECGGNRYDLTLRKHVTIFFIKLGTDPTVRFANQIITFHLSRMLLDASLVNHVIATQQVETCPTYKASIHNLYPGSTDLQCSIDGKCQCKAGVTGDKCDRCEANYWNFPEEADLGCESCDCMVEGSQGNRWEGFHKDC